jgi:hypothetical protein
VNIVTGKVVNNPAINVDDTVSVGTNLMNTFEASWPSGFYDIIFSKVKTLVSIRKHVSDSRIFDPKVIYARAMVLQKSRDKTPYGS